MSGRLIQKSDHNLGRSTRLRTRRQRWSGGVITIAVAQALLARQPKSPRLARSAANTRFIVRFACSPVDKRAQLSCAMVASAESQTVPPRIWMARQSSASPSSHWPSVLQYGVSASRRYATFWHVEIGTGPLVAGTIQRPYSHIVNIRASHDSSFDGFTA